MKNKIVIPDHDNDGRTIFIMLCAKFESEFFLKKKLTKLAKLINWTLGKFNYLGKDVDGELPEGDDTIPLDPIRETTVQGKILNSLCDSRCDFFNR